MGYALKGCVKYRFRMLAYFSATLLFGLFLASGIPLIPKTDGVKAAHIPSTTTLSMTSPAISVDLSINSVYGTFVTSEPAEFTVTTNNYTGYTLSINAKTNDANNSKLINGDYSLNSITTATPDASGFNNGDWGYKPSMLNSLDNSNFLPAPTYSGSTLNVTDAANVSADEYDITLAAKADYSLPLGTYTNDFVLAATINPATFVLHYDENTEDEVEGMPEDDSGNTADPYIELSPLIPTREGYEFMGWCEGTTTNDGYVDSCTGETYQPEGAYGLNQIIDNVINLYAMWRKDNYDITFNPTNNATVAKSQSSTVTVTGGHIAALKYLWTTTSGASAENGTTFASGDTITNNTDTGDYYLCVYAKDEWDNATNVCSGTFSLDNTGPTATVTVSNNADARTYIDYSATDTSGIIGYNITKENTQPTTWNPVYDEIESATEVKVAYGATWARVFHHNNRWNETFFANSTEAQSINTLDKYSVLGDLEKYRNSAGKFEFLLEYPDVSASRYNRWIQTANPATTTVPNGTGSETAPGYEAIHIDWTGNYWGGLALSTYSGTFINGSVGHGNWWYALAPYAAYQNAMPGPNTNLAATANLWVRVDGLVNRINNTISGRLGDISEDTTYYVWFVDSLGNVSKYVKPVERKYILKINPNGGSYNGSTAVSTSTHNFSDVVNIPNPTRAGYTFAGWNELGTATNTGFLTGVSVYNNKGNGVVTHASQSKSADNPLSTTTSEIRVTNSGSAATTPGLGGFYQLRTSEANHSYVHIFIAKLPKGYYFHEAYNSIGNNPQVQWLTSNEGTGTFKTYAYKVVAGADGTFSTLGFIFASADKNNVWGATHDETGALTWYLAFSNIYDVTSNPSGIGQLIGTSHLTANWTANNYTVTCEDWFVDASNNRKTKLGSSTKSYAYGTSVSGTAWGTDGAVSKYYSGYAYKSATSGTVPANNNLVVYRYFWAWTNLNVYYANGSTENGATVNFKVGNGSWVDVTNESNTVQPYGTTYYLRNIRPKNNYEAFDKVSNLTWNSAGYYTYTPTTGGTSMNVYMKYISYSISYTLNGGSVSGNPTSYTYATAAFTLKNPTRSGYTFTGWSGTGISGTSTSVTVPTHSTGNRSYTANWTLTCSFGVNATKDFGYTGGIQSWQVPTGCGGTFKFEVWGAQGGNNGGTGGKGGYAVGTVNLSAGTTVYVGVGGQGGSTTGGYNGGGYGYTISGYGSGAGGGGGTHIGKQNATIAGTTKANLYIVAGGGGGGVTGGSGNKNGGTGGGASGGDAPATDGYGGYGGTQSAGGYSAEGAGAYGQGGRTASAYNTCVGCGGGGGGGGLYGGGGGNRSNSGGGGGSGYTGGVSSGSMTAGSRTGNGYARITRTK